MTTGSMGTSTRPSTSAIARADGALSRIPMYRLVLLQLAVLAVVSVLASIPGWIGYSPLFLVADLAVAVGVSWLGNAVMSAIAGNSPHGESALITGLILYFLVTPAFAASGLLVTLIVLAVACLAAMASKQLVVVGGRHVLNPAATGAFVIGIAGITRLTGVGVGWWVATPVLLPFVVVMGLVLLTRVRLLGPAVLLVAIAAALETAGQLRFGGVTAGGALATSLVSTPIVFLAVFMFSEPITLPPRQWQRYAEAAVIGVLLALPYLAPFQLLTLVPTPELALLVGNALVLVVARPVAARMRLAGRRQLSPTAVEYAFRPERRVRHRAGQYLELQVPHRRPDARGIRRTFTIVSPPGDASGEVRVAVRSQEPRSSFKRTLDGLAIGAPVRAVTVSGGFTLPADRTVPLLLVASGIGITPFVSQLEDEAAQVAAGATPRDVLVVDRVPSADEIPYSGVLEGSGARVLLVVPDRADLDGVPLPDHWHVADRFDAATLRDVLPDPAARRAYVSGSPSFVHRARGVLRAAGVRHVRTDAFAGY